MLQEMRRLYSEVQREGGSTSLWLQHHLDISILAHSSEKRETGELHIDFLLFLPKVANAISNYIL